MSYAIEIKDLVKTYKDVEAVRGISLNIKKGSFFGFLGPNGAGKTTTIRILTGLCSRTSGEVRVFGKDVTRDYLETRTRIGLAPQEYNFDTFFPLEKILEFQGGYFGMNPKTARKRVAELLERFDLLDKRKVKSNSLSGGMKRRVQIVKALIHDPDILILDEPTAGIDLELRLDLWNFLRDLNKAGKTIILTTHYIEEAEKLCDEIAIIHKGKIAIEGTKDEIVQNRSKKLEDVFLEIIRPKEKKVAAV